MWFGLSFGEGFSRPFVSLCLMVARISGADVLVLLSSPCLWYGPISDITVMSMIPAMQTMLK